MTLESLLAKLKIEDVTSVTGTTVRDVTVAGAPVLGCTAVTPVTADSTQEGPHTTHVPSIAHDTVSPSLRPSEEAVIRAWLIYIREDDPTIIAEVLALVTSNPAEKERLLKEAREKLCLVDSSDDRRYCDQCTMLTVGGGCLAAIRGEMPVLPSYKPVLDLPRRCIGYMPKPDEPDQRSGRQRWPGLDKGHVDHDK
jgi:hypothetical protein